MMLKFLKNPKGALGLAILLAVLLIAIFAPILIPPELATKMDMTARLSPPSFAHPLGADQLGRDLMIRVLLGAHISILIAVASVGLAILVGLPLGIVSGYFGGLTDNVAMRVVDTLLAFPSLLLALTISAVLGANMTNTILAIAVAFTPYLARVIRGETLRVAQLPYVEAARAAGASDGAMLVRHILPSIVPVVIVQATISVAFAVLAEAGLSFLGLGAQPPDSSWGLMIQASRAYLDRAPWTALVPGAAVALTVLGLNMFGDRLRDVLDPRTKS